MATGEALGNCHRRHRHQEFLKILARIDAAVPADIEVHLVMDEYGTHKVDKVRNWFAHHARYHVHFIPRGAPGRIYADRNRRRDVFLQCQVPLYLGGATRYAAQPGR